MLDVLDKPSLYELSQRRLVASLVAQGESSVSALEIVHEDYINDPKLLLVFRAIASLVRQDEKVTPTSIAEQLDENGKLHQVGGIVEIARLKDEGDDFLLDTTVKHSAYTLKSFATKFRTYETLKNALPRSLEDSGFSGLEVLESVHKSVEEMQMSYSSTEDSYHLSNIKDDYLQLLEERKELVKNNSELDGIIGTPTSLPRLTEITSGWQPGWLVTIAARTGIGKTVFAIDQMVVAGESGKSCVFFALEMKRDEVLDRMVANISGVSQKKLKTGNVYEMEQVEKALERLEKMKITVIDTSEMTFDMIRAQCMKLSRSDDGLDMVFVDYTQLLKIMEKTGNREQDLASISRQEKMIAKQLNVVFFNISQINRPKDNEEAQTAPGSHNIRETNAFAQDSDVIIIVHRPPTTDASLAPSDIIVEKFRHGSAGEHIKCHSYLASSTFEEMQEDKNMEDLDDELGISPGENDILDIEAMDDGLETF